jgi:hypothetical protein
VCVAAHRSPFAIGHNHRRAWKRDQVLCQGAPSGIDGGLAALQRPAIDNANVFEKLVDAVRLCLELYR